MVCCASAAFGVGFTGAAAVNVWLIALATVAWNAVAIWTVAVWVNLLFKLATSVSCICVASGVGVLPGAGVLVGGTATAVNVWLSEVSTVERNATVSATCAVCVKLWLTTASTVCRISVGLGVGVTACPCGTVAAGLIVPAIIVWFSISTAVDWKTAVAVCSLAAAVCVMRGPRIALTVSFTSVGLPWMASIVCCRSVSPGVGVICCAVALPAT